jgi:hypothetical protein
MENEGTLLALVIAQGYGGFAQPASSHVWKQSHYHIYNFKGGFEKDPLPIYLLLAELCRYMVLFNRNPLRVVF